MFFGLQVKTTRDQAKPILLEETLRLGQAVLEPSKNGKKEPVSLVVEYKKQEFILCVLDHSQHCQFTLDIMFAAGSEVKFFIRGSGKVHLTGYHLEDDMAEMEMSCSSDDVSDDGDNHQVATTKRNLRPTKLNGSGHKNQQCSDKKCGPKGCTIGEAELGDETSSDDSEFPDFDLSTDDDDDDENDEDEDGDLDEDDDDEADDDDDDDDDNDDDEGETRMSDDDMDSD